MKVTSRLGLIALVPPARTAEFFGFFALAGEAASVTGPLLWAATLALFPDRSPLGYRAGLGVLFAVLVAAILAFRKVRFHEERSGGTGPRREGESAPMTGGPDRTLSFPERTSFVLAGALLLAVFLLHLVPALLAGFLTSWLLLREWRGASTANGSRTA